MKFFSGNFFLPSQVVPITGEPGFTRNTGNYTESIEVLPNAFYLMVTSMMVIEQG